MTLPKAITLCWWVMRASEAEKQMVEVEVTRMMGDNQVDNQVGNNEDAQEGRLLEKKIRVPLRNMRSMQRRRWKT